MTIERYLLDYMEGYGLWPEEATDVLRAMVAADAAGTATMARRWRDHIEGYSPPLLIALRVIANAEAVKYIDANKPHHWARAMFAQEVQ